MCSIYVHAATMWCINVLMSLTSAQLLAACQILVLQVAPAVRQVVPCSNAGWLCTAGAVSTLLSQLLPNKNKVTITDARPARRWAGDRRCRGSWR